MTGNGGSLGVFPHVKNSESAKHAYIKLEGRSFTTGAGGTTLFE